MISGNVLRKSEEELFFCSVFYQLLLKRWFMFKFLPTELRLPFRLPDEQGLC